MRINKLSATLLLSIIALVAISQERLVYPDYNPVIKNYLKRNKNLKSAAAVTSGSIVELPFIDDFAKPGIYPDTSWWANNQIYTNYTYAINPPTLGVATFDCYNEKGDLYDIVESDFFFADTLISRPINLNFPGDATIFLSFYYQKGGYGNLPEIEASLILEFYAPDDTVWNKVMAIEGGGDKTEFHQALIHINESKYLKAGFQFRFRNRASFNDPLYVTYRERDVDH